MYWCRLNLSYDCKVLTAVNDHKDDDDDEEQQRQQWQQQQQ